MSWRLAEVRIGSRDIILELSRTTTPTDFYRVFSGELSRRQLINAHSTFKLSLTLFNKNILFVEVSDSRIKYLDP